MFNKIVLLSFLGLSACVTTQERATMSRFTTPSSTGLINEPFNNLTRLREVDRNGDGFAYGSGTITDEGIIAVAGIVPGSSGGSSISSGSVSYTGRYELLRIDNISIADGYIRASQSQRTGTINLTADFDDNSLRGQSGGLVVDGVVNGTGLSGSVSFEGVDGDLNGVIGQGKAIGAFHGNDADLIYSGGFLTYRR